MRIAILTSFCASSRLRRPRSRRQRRSGRVRTTGRRSRWCAWRRTRSWRGGARCRPAAGRGRPRSRRRTTTPTATSELPGSARASWPRSRSRATPATCVRHALRGTSCWAWPSRPVVACAGRTGPIRTGAGPIRTTRASTTAPRASATSSGRCTRPPTRPGSAPPRSRACAGWSHERKAGPARRSIAIGAGRTIRPAASCTTESGWARRASCTPSTRSPTARATRASAPTHARAPRGCGS